MDLDSTLPATIRALPKHDGLVPAYRLKAPDFEVLVVVATAGTHCPTHQHDTENATAIVSGEAVVTTEAGERRVGPGEWYQSSPGEPHSLTFETDTVQIELRLAR